MKKILVVEDTLENMEVAKIFFSKINDFVFIFCANRKEAQQYLREVDAVITDRDMPFESREKEGSYTPVEGCILAIQAKNLEKDVVIISEHGTLQIGIVDEKDSNFSKASKIAEMSLNRDWETVKKEENIRFREERDIELYTRPPLIIFKIFALDSGIEIEILPDEGSYYTKIPKISEKAWLLAWQELLKQF